MWLMLGQFSSYGGYHRCRVYSMPRQRFFALYDAVSQGCVHGQPPIIIERHAAPGLQIFDKSPFYKHGMPRYIVSKKQGLCGKGQWEVVFGLLTRVGWGRDDV